MKTLKNFVAHYRYRTAGPGFTGPHDHRIEFTAESLKKAKEYAKSQVGAEKMTWLISVKPATEAQ